jgi:hypothetical protein
MAKLLVSFVPSHPSHVALHTVVSLCHCKCSVSTCVRYDNADTPKSRQIAYRRVRENKPCLWSGVAGHCPFSELIALVRNYGCGPFYFTRSVEEHQAEG